MTKSFIRAVLVVAGAMLIAATAPSATAATLTYNDPSCAGFQITGSGGSFTLTCAKLQCSISGVTNPTTAQNTSLTASCTPAGASYLWTLVSGPFSDATCNAPASPTSATTAINKPTGIAAQWLVPIGVIVTLAVGWVTSRFHEPPEPVELPDADEAMVGQAA